MFIALRLFLLISMWIVLVTSFDVFKSRLAVDYGPRYIGIAAALGENIQPICTINNHGNLTILSGEIINLARAQGAAEIIVGVPVDRDGILKYNVNNFNGILCLNFSSVLAAACGKSYPKAKVLIMDERYTTREAREKSKFEYPRASLDAVSAACLLERYLEDEGLFNVLPALPCSFPPPKDLEDFDYSLVQKHIRWTKFGESSHTRITRRKFGSTHQANPVAVSDEAEMDEVEYKIYSFNKVEHRRLLALQADNEQMEHILGTNTISVVTDSTIIEENLSNVENVEEEEEETEETEEDRQYRLRAMRRKKGTLKRFVPKSDE